MTEIYEKYVGLVFDNRYRIEQVVGIGGMAIVFKATDLLMRKQVAVKILKDEASSDAESVKRFANEYRAVAMLSHQNIVDIYDVSMRENIKYIVMEYVEGITLKNYMLHREVLNLREIISYTTQILRALDHAHKKGIVHRDIKPQNIMLLKNGIIKVMDFGIAKLPTAETITVTDKAIGTVYYISPEQVMGADIDCRSDLYSLGAMMYEMATGEFPFNAETPVSVALMQVNDAPTPPRELNSHIPVGLEQIILRAMEKDPENRYQSAEEMLSQLLQLRENPKIVFRESKAAKQKKTREEKEKAKVVRKKSHTSHSMFPIIMGVTLAFLITAGVAGWYVLDKVFFNSSMSNYKNYTIENFIGSTYTDKLEQWFVDSEYYNDPVINYVYDENIEKGTIIGQDPAPDEIRKVLPGKQMCEITLEVSLGAKTIELEDYSVRDYRMVETELKKLRLAVTIEKVESEVYEIGYVISTDPEPGTVMHENDPVKVYVSKGSALRNVMVPEFTGMSEAKAMISVLETKLRVGKVTYEKSWSSAGTVLKQSLLAWHEVPQDSVVDFTVSGGPYYNGDGERVPEHDDMVWTPGRSYMYEDETKTETPSSSATTTPTTPTAPVQQPEPEPEPEPEEDYSWFWESDTGDDWWEQPGSVFIGQE